MRHGGLSWGYSVLFPLPLQNLFWKKVGWGEAVIFNFLTKSSHISCSWSGIRRQAVHISCNMFLTSHPNLSSAVHKAFQIHTIQSLRLKCEQSLHIPMWVDDMTTDSTTREIFSFFVHALKTEEFSKYLATQLCLSLIFFFFFGIVINVWIIYRLSRSNLAVTSWWHQKSNRKLTSSRFLHISSTK